MRATARYFYFYVFFPAILCFSPSLAAAQGSSTRRITIDDEQRQEANREQAETRSQQARAVTDRMFASMDAFRELLARRDSSPDRQERQYFNQTLAFANGIESLYQEAAARDRSLEAIAERANELDDIARRLERLVNQGTDPPQLNVRLPEENLNQRVNRLILLSRDLIADLVQFGTQDALDLDLLDRIRVDLAVTQALSRALPESEF